MQTLNRSMMEAYEIESSRPSRVRAVQIGTDPILLGAVDRLIDDANRADADVGLAAVSLLEGHSKLLTRQDCMYTAFVRGDLNDEEVRREQVVQSILAAPDLLADDGALLAFARDPEVRLLILREDSANVEPEQSALAVRIAARFLIERARSAAEPGHVIICGESSDCAEVMRGRILDVASQWRAEPSFAAWLAACAFYPAMIDCLTDRSSAPEAARLCGEMNYLDAMIHISEPYAQLAIRACDALRREYPLDRCAQVRFVDDLEPLLKVKHELFDIGLFILISLGCMHGDETLADCLRDEPLRELAGRALYDEVLPLTGLERETAASALISCYERYGNPLIDNRIPECVSGLFSICRDRVMPLIARYDAEHFCAPAHLVSAVAAFILLYADARLNDSGVYEVPLGERTAVLCDDPAALRAFSRLSSDMPADSLAYAVLSDRELFSDPPALLPEVLEAELAR